MMLDTAVNSWFLTVHTPFLTAFFIMLAHFGDWHFVLPFAIALSAGFYFSPLRRYIVPLWITLVSAEVISFVLKRLVARPRPLGGLVVEHGYSFPSGHATLAVAAYGFLMYMAYTNVKNDSLRTAILVLGFLCIVLIGLCRLYLGVHYLTDVLAGYVVGSVGLFLGIYLNAKFVEPFFAQK